MKTGNKFKRLIPLLLLSTLVSACNEFTVPIRKVNYIDNPVVLGEESVDSAHQAANPPIIFADKADIVDEIFFRSCSAGEIEKQENSISGFTAYTVIYSKARANFLATARGKQVDELTNRTHIYSQNALDGKYLFRNEAIDSDRFIKVGRLSVKANLGSRISSEENNSPIKYDEHQISFNNLEVKIYDKLRALNMDGIMDLCFYYVDYEKVDAKHFRANGLMTGTAIRFKNAFYPEKKYLLKASIVDSSADKSAMENHLD